MAEPPAFLIRPCFEQDLQFVQLIYAHHVTTGTGSFELAPPDLKEMHTRWSAIAAREWPYLVACARNDPTRILGFGYAMQYKDRAGYAHTFEDSLYVAPNAIGRGIGGALLAGLLGQLQTLRVREVIAVIGDSGNAASIGVHAAKGFSQVGVLTGVGYKFGRWLDVILMQRTLTPIDDEGLTDR